jgi:ankyrin repeat protein
VSVVAWLLRFGADPNRCTKAGRATPLHRAAYMGHAEVCRLLLEAGADPSVKDVDGVTAREKAMKQGHTHVAELFRLAGPS